MEFCHVRPAALAWRAAAGQALTIRRGCAARRTAARQLRDHAGRSDREAFTGICKT
ncbi:hypothetical protein LUTEI9C_70386 [Luteimonas sp. 9C]|nr:hypothetical protein LUTEI9C_70386 [Luteimonas sp. 9C]